MSRKSKRWAKKSELNCTRREFLQTGASSAAFFTVPTLLHGLLSAQSAQAAGNYAGDPFLHIHLSGGYASSHVAIGLDANGAEVTNTTALGNIGHANDAPTRFTQIGQLKLFNDSRFTAGLLDGLNNTIPPSMQAVMLAGTSGDDNTAGARYGLVAAHAFSGLTSAVAATVGLSNSPSGNGTFPLANSAGTDFIFARTCGDIINAAQFSNELTTDATTNNRFFPAIAQGMKRIHNAQLSYRQNEGSLAKFFRNMVEALPENLLNKVTPAGGTDSFSMNALHDPITDPAGAAVSRSPAIDIYGLTARTATSAAQQTSDIEREVQMVYNLINGRLGAGSFSLGAYDYHGTADNVTGPRDFTAGQKVGRAIRLAATLNQPLWIMLTSDGGLSANPLFVKDIGTNPPGATANIRWEGDRRAFCRSFLFTVNVPAFSTHMVGNLNANGTTNESTPTGQDFLVSAVVMGSHMIRAGRSDDEIKRVLKAMGLTDTQITDVRAKMLFA